MLILGMGLMKLGIFDASRSYRFYTWMAAIGYGVGIPLNWIMGRLWIQSGFDFIAMFGYIMTTNDLGRFTVAAGHIAVVMLLVKAGVMKWVTKPLANIGRMALSNYLLTSILCTFFFYGIGFGMFAKLQRAQLLYVLAIVWAINLIFSAVWLKFYRFGPAEWLWRSLTYCKKQPMKLLDTPEYSPQDIGAPQPAPQSEGRPSESAFHNQPPKTPASVQTESAAADSTTM